jgi:hypothetical protein
MRSDTEVGMVAAHHLGGLLGVDLGCERWIGKMPSVEEVVFPSSGPALVEPPDRDPHKKAHCVRTKK